MRNYILGLVTGLCILPVMGCASSAPTGAGAPQPLKAIDTARFYKGVWHEIGRRPISLTNGCVAGATQYTPSGTGEIGVIDSCRKDTPIGELKTIGGPGQILDPGTNAKLRVRYSFLGFVPVTLEYWVLDRADDYSWFISSDPTFHDLWIYNRQSNIGEAQRRRLVKRAAALGYDVSQLEFPAQPAGR